MHPMGNERKHENNKDKKNNDVSGENFLSKTKHTILVFAFISINLINNIVLFLFSVIKNNYLFFFLLKNQI